MRHTDREIKDIKKIVELLNKSDTIRIGLFDKDFPYIVPMSFGYELVSDKIFIYLHGAKIGKKAGLIEKNANVCFELDEFNGYRKTEQSVTADYKSIIGYGTISLIENEEAEKGLEYLLKHCNIDNYSAHQCVMMGVTNVYKLIVKSFSCKSRF